MSFKRGCVMGCKHGKKGGCICPMSFGLAWGIVFGLCMLGFAWSAWLWGYGSAAVAQHAAFFYGYEASFKGGIIGGLWGLLEGFLLGFFIALFYDIISCCLKSMCCRKAEGACACCGAEKCSCKCCSPSNKPDAGK